MTPVEVEIKSSGDGPGTQVIVDGRPLRCVKAVRWSVEASGLATVELDLLDVAVDVGGSLSDARVVKRIRVTTWDRIILALQAASKAWTGGRR